MSSSRLLRRLETGILTAPSARAADCLRCERAAYRARLGDLGAARSELEAVRATHAASTTPKLTISIWLHFAEALIAHYANLAPEAHDGLSRAYALSSAAALRPMQALSAAWLAHFEYRRMNVGATARLAAEALLIAEPDHHAAQSRAKLVVAQAYHEAGRFDLARPWYDEARRHASTEGDDATLGAIMWNMAWLEYTNLRQAQALGLAVGESAAQNATAWAESSANFDALIGLDSLQSLQPILKAQILAAGGRTDESLALLDAHLDLARAEGIGYLDGVLLADRAWCLARAGRSAEAFAAAEEAAAALTRRGQPGDRASGYSRLAEVFDALHDERRAAAQRLHAERAWKLHIETQAALLAALDGALTEHIAL